MVLERILLLSGEIEVGLGDVPCDISEMLPRRDPAFLFPFFRGEMCSLKEARARSKA